MKDKKYTVLFILGAIWLVLFVAMIFGARINPRIEQVVAFLCVGWFAYLTISTVKDMFRKDDTSGSTTKQPTEKTQANGKSKKTPKA